MGDKWSHRNLKKKEARAGAIKGLPVGMKFDPQQGKDLEKFFFGVAQKVKRVLVPGGFFISFMQPRLYHRMAVAIEDAGFEVRDQLVWEHSGGQGKAFTMKHFVNKMGISREEKDALIASMGNRKSPQLRPRFESILMAQKPREGTFVDNWRKWKTGLVCVDFPTGQQTSIFSYKKPNSRATVEHLTIKPTDLMEQLLRVFSTEGQTVLDPFLGSGSTAVAAVNTHRKFIGIEKDRGYFNTSRRRVTEARQRLEAQ